MPKVIRFVIDYWGREVPVVDRKDWTPIRPVAADLDWPIPQAIKHPGVRRVIFDGVDMVKEFHGSPTVLSIPNEKLAEFQAAGESRRNKLEQRLAENAAEQIAYHKRVAMQKARGKIAATYRTACAEALRECNRLRDEAGAAFRKARAAAQEVHDEADRRAQEAYQGAVAEALEDRDDAFDDLETDDDKTIGKAHGN